jgi:acyl-CoA synthetase (AMP-forming)/AMP-acid ligase II
VVDGELYVLGRLDDVLIIGGRNFHAGHLERILGERHGGRIGTCAFVDLPIGTERPHLVLLAEPPTPPGDAHELARTLAATALRETGLPVDECVFLPRGSFPRTASGKVQRYRARELALSPPSTATRVSVRVARGRSDV